MGAVQVKREFQKRGRQAVRRRGAMFDRRRQAAAERGAIEADPYDSSGYMSVQVAPDQERKKAGSTPTPEAQAALVEYIAYSAPTRSTSRPPRSRTTARAASAGRPARGGSLLRIRGRSADPASARQHPRNRVGTDQVRRRAPGAADMNVLMPQLGETVAEGKIAKWFKSARAAVKPGDNLFEIETDKVSMEVPSTTAGVLSEIRVPAGDVAPVGAIVAVISDGAGAAASAPAAAPPKAPVSPSRAAEPPRARAASSRAGARGRSIRSSRCARPRAITGRHGCRAAPGSRRWRAGSPARRGSISAASCRRVRTAASWRATSRR